MRSGLVSDKQTRPVWPPYWPSILSRTLHEATDEDDIIFSDQPWAVAWYADRRSIWLPKKVSEFENLEKLVEDQGLTSAGILMTPSSFKDNPLYKPGHFGGQRRVRRPHAGRAISRGDRRRCSWTAEPGPSAVQRSRPLP